MSLKDQKYTHIKANEAMDVMRSYMTDNTFTLEFFNIQDILYWSAYQQRLKVNKK